MSSLTTYKNLSVLTPDPIGLGGLAINNNFKSLADSLTAIKGVSISSSLVIPANLISSVQIPYDSTITGWAVISTDGIAGSISFDVLAVSAANLVPNSTTHATDLVGSGTPPALSSANIATGSVSNWPSPIELNAGDYLIFVTQGTPTVFNVRLELTLVPR